MSNKRMYRRVLIPLTIFLFTITSQSFSQNNELDDLLRLDIKDLTDISVSTATKTLSKINEVPATIKVITSETIRENRYFTLEDVLSDLPGFQFRNIQGFNSYIFQRGIPNQNNLVLLLVDGIQINELNSGGFYGGGQFNLNDVKQIEIVYGPASSLYGTNAISGIINIITKDPVKNRGLEISGRIGSFKTYDGSIAYGYYNEEDQLGFRIACMAKTSEKADLASAEGDNNWSSDMENFEDDYSVNFKGQYKSMTLGLLFQNKQASRTTNYKTIGSVYLDKNTLWNIGFFNAYLKYNYNICTNFDMRTTLYYRNTTILDNTIAYITNKSQTGYYRPNRLVGLENLCSYVPIKDLKFVGGLLFEYESLAKDYSITVSNSPSEKPPIPSSPAMDNNTLFSLFLQTQYSICDSLNLFGGARFDHSSVYDNILTPRLGLVYNQKSLTIKLMYSEAFRAPKPWDYRYGIGNSDLESEKINSLEMAASYLIDENFKADVSVYRNKLSDLIIQETTDLGSLSVNKGDVETIGIETSLDYKRKPFGAFLNYTFNSSEDENGVEISEIAKHSMNFGVSYYVHQNLQMLIRCNYLGKRKNSKIIGSTDSDYIDAAFVFSAGINYTGFEHFSVNLSVRNLFDKVYYHTSNRPPDRYRQPQRVFLLEVDYNI